MPNENLHNQLNSFGVFMLLLVRHHMPETTAQIVGGAHPRETSGHACFDVR